MEFNIKLADKILPALKPAIVGSYNIVSFDIETYGSGYIHDWFVHPHKQRMMKMVVKKICFI